MLTQNPLLKINADEVAILREKTAGRVITPADHDYDAARKAWNLTVDQHPALIVVAQNTQDVATAIRFANQFDLGVAMQATGHGVARPADDALLILTKDLNQVEISASTQVAKVGAGAKWYMVLEAAQEVGLAPLLGSSPMVSVAGYTLGGGMGWLARQYGLALDSVRAFEVVTAAGQIRRVSQYENPDLFWALRGGGGSFAAVTAMEIMLYPVTTVFGGNLFYPASMAKEVMTHYRNWIADAPDELTCSIVLMNFPPFPQVPEFLRGQSFVIVRGCYCGAVEEGEALLRHWLDWQTPVANMWREMPFSEVASISNDPVDPVPAKSTAAWLKDLDDAVFDTLIDHVIPANGPSPLMFAEIRLAGGAIARVATDANAYSNREAKYILQMVGAAPFPEAYRQLEAYTGQIKAKLQDHLTGSVYINFLEHEEARDQTRAAYRADVYARLCALKAVYDPDNRFRYSLHIPVGQA